MAAGWRRRVLDAAVLGLLRDAVRRVCSEPLVYRVVDPPRADAASWTKGFHAIEQTQSLREMSRSDGFGVEFGVRPNALNESASVATAEHHYRPVLSPVPWRTCAVCFEILSGGGAPESFQSLYQRSPARADVSRLFWRCCQTSRR